MYRERKTILNNGKEILFKDLKKGDKFRLFEPDGDKVIDEGYDLFLATSNAYLNKNDVWEVQSECIGD